MSHVSVIIPTYKHRDFVLATLDSVFAQTFTDYEVIVVNDGSPDDTADVLKPLAEAGRIHYIEQANQGQAAARNRGLAEAQGEFIAFLDDDDLWPADKLEWQVQRLRDDASLGMVAGNMQTLGNAANPALPLDAPPHIAEFEQLFYGCPLISPGQALLRANVVKNVGGFDIAIWGADDYDLWFRLAKVTRIELWQRVALYYRKHSLNASRDLLRMHQNCEIVLRRHLRTLSFQNRFFYHRVSSRSLYEYLGRQILLQAKSLAVEGNARLGFYKASLLRVFLVSLIFNPKLALMVYRDLTAPSKLV